MNRKIALIGLVIFIAGIAILATGVGVIAASTHHSNVYTTYSAGKYIGAELNFRENTTLTISNAPSGMGLVRSADMPSVTSGSLNSVEIKPLTNAAGALVYQVPAGSYYVVYFGSSSPGAVYTYLYTGTVFSYGLLTGGGILLAITGAIVGIIGVVLHPRQNYPVQ